MELLKGLGGGSRLNLLGLGKAGGSDPPAPLHMLQPIFNVPGTTGIILDTSYLNTMWQDAGKTTPVASYGDKVSVWSDVLGSGIDFTARADAERPEFRDDKAEPYITFRDALRNLRYLGDALDYAQPSVFVKITSYIGQHTCFIFPHAATHINPYARLNIFRTNSAGFSTRWNGVIMVPDMPFPADTPLLLGQSPSIGKLWVNETEHSRTPVDPITYPNHAGVFIGCSSSYTERFSGEISGICIFNRATTTDDLALLQAWAGL